MTNFISPGTDELIQMRHYTIWQLIKLYWQSSERISAYIFFSTILVMTIFIVGIEVVFNYWYNYFYNALQAYNVDLTVRLLGLFCVLAAIAIVISVYRYYVSQLLALRWRRWLTKQFIARWLKRHGYYYLENFDAKTDNPDQRIQEDIGTLATNTIDLVTGLIAAVASFFAFIYVLWGLSGVINVPLGSLGVLHVHGYLVWVSLIYSFVGTLLTIKIGKPLIPLNFEQQRREASFRYAAIDLRAHAEDVALYRGEQHQRSILYRYFGGVLENWYAIILRQKLLLWFTAGFNQVSVLLPLVVALPNYFGKVFLLGGLIQSLSAFGKIQEALSYIINSYPQIATWQAIGQRLTTFINHLDDIEEDAINADHLAFHRADKNAINIKNVTVRTPRDKLLLENINIDFMQGQNYLIKGESGLGKSTFIRAIAGIWPYADGEITLPAHKSIMYVPQKPYMPIGTLAEAILFPDKHQPDLHKNLEQVLRDCHLEMFIPRLNDVAPWSEQLSPGEQQRISFARVLLHKPDWVFLDESTSMLDLANEKYLYGLVKSILPNCTIVSVGHRPSLDVFHDEIIDVTKFSVAEGGAN